MSLSLTYMDDLSRVRITGTDLPAGSVTVERSFNGLLWTTVRGGIAVAVDSGGISVDDYEFSPGVENHYRIRSAVDETLDAPSTDQANGDPWTVPPGVGSLVASCTGAGGTGGGAGTLASAGAGGGAWAGSTLNVTPGETLNVLVGKSDHDGLNGNRSAVIRSGTVLVAADGGYGPVLAGTPGLGGSDSSSIGDAAHSGGDGGTRQGSTTAGGGGGASGSPTGPGADGSAGSSGTGGAGGSGNADDLTLPEITDVSTGTGASTASWSVDAPSGNLNGQVLLLLHSCMSSNIADMPAPTGGAEWNLLEEGEDFWGPTFGGSSRLWWKVGGSSEPSSYGLTQESGDTGVAIVCAVAGADVDSLASDATSSTSGSGTAIPTPAVALPSPGGLDLRFGGTIGSSTITIAAPANWDLEADVSSSFAHAALASRSLGANAGTSQNLTLSTSSTDGRFGATVTLAGTLIEGGDGGNGPGGAGGDTDGDGEAGGVPGGGGGGRGGDGGQTASGHGAHGQVVLSSWTGDEESASITPDLGKQAWLKSIRHPFLNRPIHRALAGGGQSIGRAARGSLHQVQGRSAPVAVTDVRSSREFTLTIQVPDEESARDMDLILASGDVFYLQVPPEMSPHMAGGYVRIGDTEQYRLADTIMWRFVLPCTVVTPPGPGVVGTTMTWRTVLRLYGSWEALLASNATWNDLLTTVGSVDDLVVL